MREAMTAYLYHLLIALDQLANAILFGHADETLSSRAWRVEQKGRLWGIVLRPVIDMTFLVITLGADRHHCQSSFESERLRKQLPAEFSAEASKGTQ
ncbi:hypothetical protein [Quisquiliibacterium transsilvanicum]|uniref:Uncharacterized protein n=1 Tax=Quisquiliibacterium transsilvanicum TaxID=1549638 RepID=A0A7W8HG97_9BURK|nr:hypothetical protein [Quisquiliibacterium transsilvanicum]MBB5271549.1 hypothetical protein [Quisquiliibacterium transsilvanicum]